MTLQKKKRSLIQMRFYKRFDSDLIAISSMGISLASLASLVLEHYARGETVKLMIPHYLHYNIDSRDKALHLAFRVKSDEAEEVMRSVLPGYRNQFCKTLIRNALVIDPIWPYLKPGEAQGRAREDVEGLLSGGTTPQYIVLEPGRNRQALKIKELPRESEEAQETEREDKPFAKTAAPPQGEITSAPTPATAKPKRQDEPKPAPKPTTTQNDSPDDDNEDFMSMFDALM